MTFFVKIPEKYRRGWRFKGKPAPIWIFSDQLEAIKFAESFKSCRVEVWYKQKVIYRNFSIEIPKWYSEQKAA